MEQRAWCADCGERDCGRPSAPRPALRLVASRPNDEGLPPATRGSAGVGVVFGRMLPNGEFRFDVAPEAQRHPHLLRRALAQLDRKLAALS